MTIRNLNIINLILILFIFPSTALLVKDYIVYRRVKIDVSPASVALPVPVPRKNIQAYAPVVEAPVFPTPGRVFNAVAGPLVDQGVDPEAISSGLKLVGTFVSREGRPSSFAVFEKTGEKKQKIFKKGEIVFGAGLLKEIEKERVVLKAGSRSITFTMEKIPKATAFTPANVTTGAGGGGGGVPRYSKKTGENQWVVSREAVLNALDDMGSVLTAARLTPVVRDGAIEGFLVTEVKPRGIMDAIGLKNGDILKRVNDYEMTSPERAIQVLTSLKGQTNFELDIVRGGQNMSFHYEMR